MTVRNSAGWPALWAAMSSLIILTTGSGCGAERVAGRAALAQPPVDRGRPDLKIVPSARTGDLLSFPWGMVRLISIRVASPPSKLAGAPEGARLLAPAEVELEITGEHAGRRALALTGWTKDETGEMRVAVKDPAGAELWSMGWGGDRPGQHTAFESAPGVELKMRQEPLPGGQVAESYRLRIGPLVKECRIAYDPLSPSGQQAALAEFGRFYIAGTALDDNFDGHLASSLLMDRGFVLWTANQLRHPRVLYRDIAELGGEKNLLSIVCAAAATCSFLKCGFGGLLNPVCDFCSGIAFACALIDLLGWG